MTPDSADSTGKGTRMRSARSLPVGGSSFSLAMASCQTPLRLSQASRRICGRGYSGRALSAFTSFAQRVRSGPSAGFQSAAAAAPAKSTTAVAATAARTRGDHFIPDMGVNLP